MSKGVAIGSVALAAIACVALFAADVVSTNQHEEYVFLTNLTNMPTNYTTVIPFSIMEDDKVQLEISARNTNATNVYSVTNLELWTVHDPILLGRTNGGWMIRFK